MTLVLEINEAESISLVIDDNLLLLVRKELGLAEGLSLSQGWLVAPEGGSTFTLQALKCRGEEGREPWLGWRCRAARCARPCAGGSGRQSSALTE